MLHCSGQFTSKRSAGQRRNDVTQEDALRDALSEKKALIIIITAGQSFTSQPYTPELPLLFVFRPVHPAASPFIEPVCLKSTLEAQRRSNGEKTADLSRTVRSCADTGQPWELFWGPFPSRAG